MSLLNPAVAAGLVLALASVSSGTAVATSSARGSAAAAPRLTSRLLATGTSSSNCVAWTGIQPPSTFSSLKAVATTSPCNAWAVGGFQQTSILHWNGSSWTVAPSPNPVSGTLTGVAATSARNAWAVGDDFSGTGGGDRTLILHWGGAAWAQQPSPDPGGPSAQDDLSAVAATSARNAWAVGSTNTLPLIEHWNGTAWKRVASPVPAGTLSAELDGVAATSASNAWAVGTYNNGKKDLTLIEHWDGTVWKRMASPNPSNGTNIGTILRGVAASSAGNAWAVGTYVSSDKNENRTLTEHWNGTRWNIVASPNLDTFEGFDVLSGVAVISARNAWAVGFYAASNSDPAHTLVEHWNGTTWTHVKSPNLQGSVSQQPNYLFGVAATSATNVWAVGSITLENDGPVQPLALHCC
jgi:hypothetical protein